eukprot:2726287-Pleurochrysis_carterae.AAC.1
MECLEARARMQEQLAACNEEVKTLKSIRAMGERKEAVATAEASRQQALLREELRLCRTRRLPTLAKELQLREKLAETAAQVTRFCMAETKRLRGEARDRRADERDVGTKASLIVAAQEREAAAAADAKNARDEAAFARAELADMEKAVRSAEDDRDATCNACNAAQTECAEANHETMLLTR